MVVFSSHQFSSVQSFSCDQLFVTPWSAACQASLCITNSPSLLELMSIESVMSSTHLIFFIIERVGSGGTLVEIQRFVSKPNYLSQN